ncbi:MAG: MBL fold metallo-hydrolase [Balneolaceae bacterium]|nr:MBL fold metallo-hydrolase [Balneolaceae bacterium]
MYFKQFFDEKLAQYSYMVGCQANGEAVVIDPMRDIDQYIEEAAAQKLTIVAAADTHIHADYLSGLREFAERGIKVYASDEGDADWKYEWLLNNNSYDYQLMYDGDAFKVGNIEIKAWHTPGHTPEHLSYFITDGAAANEPIGITTGDFVFVGDVGRPDLLESAADVVGAMEPSARTLYSTVESFKSMPEYMQVWPGHGAGSACGKALGAIPETTVGYELRYNASIKAASSEDNFVNFILDGQPEPPMYFARMKRDNKIGPRVLKDNYPKPRRLSVQEFGDLDTSNVVVLDTRSKEDFIAGHLKGSLLSPMDKQFNTIAGSFILEDEEIYLVIDEDRVDEAVTDLIRIGLDHIKGFITPADLASYGESSGGLETMSTMTFEDLDTKVNEGFQVVDVRKATEYAEGHAEGATNISHTRLKARKDELGEGGKYVVHCKSGARAAVSASLLKREGHEIALVQDDVANLASPVTA